jgi:hypothetical protein
VNTLKQWYGWENRSTTIAVQCWWRKKRLLTNGNDSKEEHGLREIDAHNDLSMVFTEVWERKGEILGNTTTCKIDSINMLVIITL